jgi:hypothetical protein
MIPARLLALASLAATSFTAGASPFSPWLVNDAVRDHYHERAVLAPVSITESSGHRFTLDILAKQAHFQCELAFDRTGRPHVVDHCAIDKIDAFGRVQHDVAWSVPGPIELTCRQQPGQQTCIGEYTLVWHHGDGSYGGAETRVLRLVRRAAR